MSITFEPLPYITFDLGGGLSPLYIGPAPDANGITKSGTIFINANLPNLGLPPKPGVGGPGGGQYVEIIIDDSPTLSRITTSVPHAIKLAEGTHMLHFILSAGDGECIKNDGNCISRVVHIENISQPYLPDPGSPNAPPVIMYNLPRAVHRSDDVILDFGLMNVGIDDTDPTIPATRQLMRDVQVKVFIDGQLADILDYWNAYKIKGLSLGTHTIELRLRDRNGGAELTAPYTRTAPRTFTVRSST